jgi:cysteine synthase A
MKIANSMLDLVGSIPLVRLNRIGKETGSEILVKPEFLNPSGSIKDRIAKLMIESAEQKGQLNTEKTIIEATTGNTGTSLAFLSAVKGYKFVAFAPSKVANRSRMAIMQAFGAKLEIVDIEKHIDDQRQKKEDEVEASVHGGRIELTGRQVCLNMEKTQTNIWWARQFSNPLNVEAHREGTGREIIDQTDGILDAFVASVGTGGTLLGVAQALKAHNPNILIIGVEPISSPMLGAPEDYPIIPGISDGIIPQLFESNCVDMVIAISDDEAIKQTHELAEKEGIFCGISSGANVLASIRIAQKLGPGKRIVTILPDSRDRYLEVEKYTT